MAVPELQAAGIQPEQLAPAVLELRSRGQSGLNAEHADVLERAMAAVSMADADAAFVPETADEKQSLGSATAAAISARSAHAVLTTPEPPVGS